MAVIFLLLALLLQTFSKMVVVADFYATRDYIVKNLCINRYRTAISCGGTCQLNKRLNQENKSNGDTGSRPDNRYEVLSSRCFYLTSFIVYQPGITRDYPLVPVACPIDRPAAIFHPPGWSLPSPLITG